MAREIVGRFVRGLICPPHCMITRPCEQYLVGADSQEPTVQPPFPGRTQMAVLAYFQIVSVLIKANSVAMRI